MSALKTYFAARVGRSMVWSFEGGSGRFDVAHRREYTIRIMAVGRGTLSAEVSAHDFDRSGGRLTRVPTGLGTVKVPLEGLSTTPIEALEDAARAADPPYFEHHPRAHRAGAAGDAADSIDGRLRALDAPESRGKGEAQPNPASVERFRRFWAATPGLFMPEVFSSKDGTVRARWQDGHDRTLWINYPAAGPLGWSAAVPRVGSSGLRRMNARCPDDQDIIPMAGLLGIRCGH